MFRCVYIYVHALANTTVLINLRNYNPKRGEQKIHLSTILAIDLPVLYTRTFFLLCCIVIARTIYIPYIPTLQQIEGQERGW